MSIELALIPIAIAVAGTMKERRERARARSLQPEVPEFSLATRMKDEVLLQTALENYGCHSVRADDGVTSDVSGSQIRFGRNEQGAFDAAFTGDISPNQAESFLTEVYEQYTLLVQQQVYTRLLARASARGLTFESEYVQPDGSIVMTLLVQESR